MNISYVRIIHTKMEVVILGRPRKWEGPVKRLEAWIPYETYQEMDNEKSKRGLTWSELILEAWDAYKTVRG